MTTTDQDPIEFVINYIQNVTKLYPVITPAATLLYGILSNNSLGLALTVFAIITDLLNNLAFKKISELFMFLLFIFSSIVLLLGAISILKSFLER